MNWLDINKGTLIIKECNQYFHHHSKEILAYHENLIGNFINGLEQEIEIKTQWRKSGNKRIKGISASLLNNEIRKLLITKFSRIKLEVEEQRGVYYFSSKNEKKIGGFDFAFINSQNNLIKLRNLCFGKIKYDDGKKRWDAFLEMNDGLREFSKSLIDPLDYGNDLKILEESEPLILGEIQFGNWALKYYDFFKLLNANVQTSVDCLIYIVATGDLEKYLSSAIVNYDKSLNAIKQFEKVINVPIWLIGLDIKI